VLTRHDIFPRLDWLRKVSTSHARHKINAQLRRENTATPAPQPTTEKPAWHRR